MTEQSRFRIHLRHLEKYAFNVEFDWDIPPMILDEDQPLGDRHGPNASRLLAAAAANCLSASLLFCLAKNNVEAASLVTEASGSLIRNDKGRLRVGRIDVVIRLATADHDAKIKRCSQMFEDFCVVTASLRQGFPVGVQVLDSHGELVHQSANDKDG